jgi:hypothetical protein
VSDAPIHSATSFTRSMSALAELGMKATSALGYTLFQRTPETRLTSVAGYGQRIEAAELAAGNDQTLLALPLRGSGYSDGIAAYRFASMEARSRANRPLLLLGEAMQALWAVRGQESAFVSLARRLSALESQLIDSRIADRAHGVLTDDVAPPALERIAEHVRSVLESASTTRSIEQLLKELEDEIDERRVAAEAKAILQKTHALSEEQAYTHLRLLSRKSRRRVRDVARDIVEQHSAKAKTA